jgi:hypothetical protein
MGVPGSSEAERTSAFIGNPMPRCSKLISSRHYPYPQPRPPDRAWTMRCGHHEKPWFFKESAPPYPSPVPGSRWGRGSVGCCPRVHLLKSSFRPHGKVFQLPQLCLTPKYKFKINYPPDPDRNRAKPDDFRRTMAVKTLPREGAAKIKIKSVLKYSWVRSLCQGAQSASAEIELPAPW